MAVLLKDMLAGRSDGVFGFVTTHVAALAGAGLHAAECLHFFPYRAVCPYLYGSALMVAPRLIRDHPDAVARLIQALRDGIVAAREDPEAALDAMIASYPAANRQVERERLIGTLTGDIACPPGTLGEIDAGRLRSTIQCLSSALGWPSTPDSRRIFTPSFLDAPH
jgi:ABC-type nitrate/sulfonate/bicarbonate transport system substrate-binding protein